MTAPPDGTTLEEVIGDLQSVWGVPQYPQEFRITLKVADERETRAERAVSMDDLPDEKSDEARPGLDTTSPRREKAPAAPRVAAADGTQREKAPRRRRRARRKRRGGTA
ncbi:MAG: hypothetical protein ACRDJI_05180 [Actinomycetota bacterium]